MKSILFISTEKECICMICNWIEITDDMHADYNAIIPQTIFEFRPSYDHWTCIRRFSVIMNKNDEWMNGMAYSKS